MNQILYTGGKNKKSGMSDKNKIVIFFVIFIIIFASCLIFIGSNLLSKVKNNNVGNNNPTQNPSENINPNEPVIQEANVNISFESEVGGVKITVESIGNTIIQSVTYWWDEEEAVTSEVSDVQYETVVASKQGTHKLNVEVIDENGNKKTIDQIVIGDAGPEVTILTDGVSNYVIRAKDDEKVEKLVIILNGETQEITVNDKEIEYTIPIPQGDSLIEVTAYNLNGLTTNKKAKITNFGG